MCIITRNDTIDHDDSYYKRNPSKIETNGMEDNELFT